MRTCLLRPSNAQWGFGVYLTDLPPTTPRARLSQLFGRRRFYGERLKTYVRIPRDKADADPHDDDPRVFVAPGKVSIAGEDPVEIGIWRGTDDPNDRSGYKAATFSRCVPDAAELRQAFEDLLP